MNNKWSSWTVDGVDEDWMKHGRSEWTVDKE